MRKPLSIKKRIFSGLVTLCLLAIISFSLAIKVSSDYLENIILTSNYQDELAEIKKSQSEGKMWLPRSTHTFGFLASNGDVPIEFINYGVGEYHDIVWQGKSYHLIVSPIESKTFKQDMLYIAQQIEAIERYEDQLNFILIVLLLSLTIASIWLAFWFTSLIANPITELSNNVSALQAGESKLSTHIQDTDLAPIENAINSYLARIHEYLLKEKLFSGIASHELRTPISTIRSSLETFMSELKKNPLDEKQQQRIERIQRASIEMQYITESLLYLVKQDIEDSHEKTSYALAPLLQEIIDEHDLLKRNKDIQIILHNDFASVSQIKKTFLKIIVGNLLRNSLENTVSGSIIIQLAENTITLEDSGKGLPQDVQDYLNEKPFIGLLHKQVGIGLFLVARLCDQLDIKLLASKSTQFEQGSKIQLTLH